MGERRLEKGVSKGGEELGYSYYKSSQVGSTKSLEQTTGVWLQRADGGKEASNPSTSRDSKATGDGRSRRKLSLPSQATGREKYPKKSDNTIVLWEMKKREEVLGEPLTVVSEVPRVGRVVKIAEKEILRQEKEVKKSSRKGSITLYLFTRLNFEPN